MNPYISFLIKTVLIGIVVSQTTRADTGYQVIGLSITEPIYLSICGLGLFYLGVYRKNKFKGQPHD